MAKISVARDKGPRTALRLEMKDKGYTAIACGFNFTKGVAYARIDLSEGSIGQVGLQNILSIFPGTSYKEISDEEAKKYLRSAADEDRDFEKERIREEVRAELIAEMAEKEASGDGDSPGEDSDNESAETKADEEKEKEPEEEPLPKTRSELEDMNKEELKALCRRVGVEYKTRDSSGNLEDKLAGFLSIPPDEVT